jgi:hypothetical protein
LYRFLSVPEDWRQSNLASLPILPKWPGLAQVFWADGSPARFTHLGAFISARKEMTKFQGAALASEYLQSGFVRLEKPWVTEPFYMESMQSWESLYSL